ncbi:MAG: Tim44-like domain-containing protein [Gammaproteobacteria bacterium]|nr:Tim44-like domain-containing protein [Gammaproteobacteria bacterium]
MKQISVITFSLFIGFFMSVAAISDAEAKRFGGGKSFGSNISKNNSAKRTSSTQNKAQQQNTDRKQAMSKKGGMMGLLGGLMIGGMLGALFFGGAFENINFMDILLFGGIAFLLFKLLTRGRGRQQTATANGAPIDMEETSSHQTRQSSESYGSADANFNEEPENILKTGKIPRGFDQKSFLSGAENVYELLQKAWDSGDLGDLRQFSTDNVFAELQDQFRLRNSENKTEIISLKSELVNVVISNSGAEATVVFNAEVKEFDNDDKPEEITYTQEAWYFVRPDNRNEHNWLLDGIQQLED